MKVLVESFYGWYRQMMRHDKYRWVIIAGTLLYLLSPVDISADFLPLVGWLDDGILATMLVSELSQILVERRRQDATIASDTDSSASNVTIDVTAS
ncbi:DUF1232 domain-containing protein [Lusitaniella coriacea LEGE 07157]|uniref:DUF1232 domain-containing protein n=1 Tax=Lusitaniella coriacea LEGE 07157 TaxID=945747 RepID=A0A8J7DWD4_9CYAN|nr:YkvA family protein [Lusitaniella coriacea]MBE9116356.1 DUF1232 domain-containing protein [Lusitaniella coriacea LEGE 07157]